jgi:peroxiredoxin
LRRWEQDLRPELDARGIRIVTLCGDTPEEIRRGRDKHGARATMLSDAQLEITDRYNLRNEGSLTPKGMKATPIPTTILVDREGHVRWIDQASDYQIRSHPDQVLAAIRTELA